MFDELYQELLKKDPRARLPDQRVLWFLKNELLPRLFKKKAGPYSILEIGVGLSTLFDDQSLADEMMKTNSLVTSLDLSSVSIRHLEHLEHPLGGSQEFIEQDFLDSSWLRAFDLIIDTSCFHCLCFDQAQERYLKKIYSSLKVGGLFFLQSMVEPKKLALEDSFEFDQKRAVLKKNGHDWRRLLQAHKIESELEKNNLKIEYFKVFSEEKVILSKERQLAMSSDPEVLRLIAQASS